MLQVKRVWINQPSIHQPLHRMHGTLAIAIINPNIPKLATICPINGDVISLEVFEFYLSDGWPKHLMPKW